MTEASGVLLAIASSALGGTAAAVTRYLVASADPVTIAILRWGIGVLCVIPAALYFKAAWPKRADWFGVSLLGALFLWAFFHSLQYRDELHDGRTCEPRAFNATTADDGCWRRAGH